VLSSSRLQLESGWSARDIVWTALLGVAPSLLHRWRARAAALALVGPIALWHALPTAAAPPPITDRRTAT
jgi:hypothetical protein